MQSTAIEIIVYEADGKIVLTKTCNSETSELDLSTQSKGLHYAGFKHQGIIQHFKIIKQ